jgi:hypothetical protein
MMREAVEQKPEKFDGLYSEIFHNLREILELGVEPQELADRLGCIIDIIVTDLRQIAAEKRRIAEIACAKKKLNQKCFVSGPGIGRPGNPKIQQAIAACFIKGSR